MKEKMKPHIIAAGALVVFIVLGLACASTDAADGSPKTGGVITVKNTSKYDVYYATVEKTPSEKTPSIHEIQTSDNHGYADFSVKEDGEYTIRYTGAHRENGKLIHPGLNPNAYSPVSSWSGKTVNVSGGKYVTVNIP